MEGNLQTSGRMFPYENKKLLSLVVNPPLSADSVHCATWPGGADCCRFAGRRRHAAAGRKPRAAHCVLLGTGEEQSGERSPRRGAPPHPSGKRRTNTRHCEAEPGGGRAESGRVGAPVGRDRRHGAVLGERPGAGPGRAGGGPGVP